MAELLKLEAPPVGAVVTGWGPLEIVDLPFDLVQVVRDNRQYFAVIRMGQKDPAAMVWRDTAIQRARWQAP